MPMMNLSPEELRSLRRARSLIWLFAVLTICALGVVATICLWAGRMS